MFVTISPIVLETPFRFLDFSPIRLVNAHAEQTGQALTAHSVLLNTMLVLAQTVIDVALLSTPESIPRVIQVVPITRIVTEMPTLSRATNLQLSQKLVAVSATTCGQATRATRVPFHLMRHEIVAPVFLDTMDIQIVLHFALSLEIVPLTRMLFLALTKVDVVVTAEMLILEASVKRVSILHLTLNKIVRRVSLATQIIPTVLSSARMKTTATLER
jgi:hypothetical protein